MDYGPRNTCTVEHGPQSIDIWMYGPSVAPNCYRFANPAEALRGFEASRLCGLHVLDRNRHQKRFSTKTIPSGMNFKIFIVL